MRYRLIAAALFAVVEVCACNNIDFNTLLLNENSSSTAKLNACMLNEINSRAANGTLFTSGLGVKATAEDVANDCIRKLTLPISSIPLKTRLKINERDRWSFFLPLSECRFLLQWQ